ncbi:hypothetical protein LTS18_012622, partial [Coniosporium uncinatum]
MSGEIAAAQGTPTKAVETPAAKRAFGSPEFHFTFKREPSVELSEAAQKLMAEKREEAARIRAQMKEQMVEEEKTAAMFAERKIAKPKGRFSDAHKAMFDKMESLGNRPVKKTEAPTLKPATTSMAGLKRSPSKAELDMPDSRSQAKRLPMQKRTEDAEPASQAKRVKHQQTDDASTARPISRDSDSSDDLTTPPKRTSTTLMRSQSVKNIKTGIPKLASVTTPTKSSLARSQSVKSLKVPNIPSLARSPSVQTLNRSPSHRQLGPASNLQQALHVHQPQEGQTERVQQPLSRLPSLKSLNGGVRGILRTPQRLYSNDPNKVAAGTHLATPPGKRASMLNLNKDVPAAPATAPVRKHVDFSHSTKEREVSKSSTPPRDPADIAMEDDTESLASPTPRHSAIQPELKPTEAIAYPSLAPSSPLARPIIQPRSISKSTRRQTLGPMTTASVPGSFPADFTFRAGSEVPVSFASPSPVRGRTIRAVRNSDGPSLIASVTNSPSKRKFEGLGNFAEENEVETDAEAAASDKENFA